MSYQFEYDQSTTTLKTDIYLDGKKIDCPAVIRNSTHSSDEPLPTCEEIREELKDEGDDAIQCT
jgi:hypothetical protein